MVKQKIITLFFIVSFFQMFSQQFSIEHYSTAEGLSNSCVYGMHQDKDGFLWVATEYGLNKFDGKNFVSYDVSNGFPDNITLSAIDGFEDELLVGTHSKGIVKLFKDGKIQKLIDPFNHGQISKFFKVEFNLYLHSNFKAAIYNLKSNKLINFAINNSKDSVVNAICLWNNKILLATDMGLVQFSESEKYIVNNAPELKKISTLYTDKNGHIWAGVPGVIYKLNKFNLSITDSIVFDQVRKNKLDCILLDHHNDLWFSTSLPIGLYHANYNNNYNTFEDISSVLKIGSTDINDLLLDRENNIWIATYNKGLYCIRNTFLYTNSSFQNMYINSIFVDSKSNVYIGGLDGIHIIDKFGKSSNAIMADKNTREYTYGFNQQKKIIIVRTNGKYIPYTTVKNNGNELLMIKTRSVLFVNDTTAMFGGWHNDIYINKFKNNKPSAIIKIKLDSFDYLNNRINKLIFDKDGFIWCAADLGIYRINLKQLKSQKINAANFSQKINDIVIDSNNTIWFATENSIVKYQNNIWTNYTHLNNQNIGKVNSLAIDKKNRLYIGTLKGLFILDHGIATHLDNKSGLSSNEINELAYDSLTNKLLIATNDSYCELNITQYEKFKKLPLFIKITAILNQDSLLPLQNTYVLNYTQNNIRINFTAINLTYPKSVVYQYKTDDGDWLNTNSNSINLAALSYNTHQIKVRASLDYKTWCQPAVVFITIKPPFYLTWLFYTVILIFIFLIAFFLIQYRFKIIKVKAAQTIATQKQIEELKFRSLNASINPHFIFNSLNSIQNYINHNDKNKASNFLAKFARLIRLVLDKANDKEILITEEIDRLKYYMDLEQDRFSQNFTYKIFADPSLYQLAIPNMIIQPLVENAILHGVKDCTNAHIIISFIKTNTTLTILVDDDGVGIVDNSKSDNSLNHKSMAIANIKERLTIYPNSFLEIINKKKLDINTTGTISKIVLQL